jgi:hypothetical protein
VPGGAQRDPSGRRVWQTPPSGLAVSKERESWIRQRNEMKEFLLSFIAL